MFGFNKAKSDFTFAVMDVYKQDGSNNLVVLGMVNGSVETGDSACMDNLGFDNFETKTVEIVSIEIDKKPVSSAKNTYATLEIENGLDLGIRIGSVIHTNDMTLQEIFNLYLSSIASYYINFKDMELTDEDIEKMSFIDCLEVWRIYFTTILESNKSDAEKASLKAKSDKIAHAACKKLMKLDAVYVPFNKKTGEPHMLTFPFDTPDGQTGFQGPDIVFLTKRHKELLEHNFDKGDLELKKIENTEDGKAFENFFGSTFYLNGALGVRFAYPHLAVSGKTLVPPPDYSGLPEASIPVMNPDVTRWLLLIAQLPEELSQEDQKNFNLFHYFLGKALPKAQFLLPMKCEDGEMTIGENAKPIFSKGTKIVLPLRPGKDKKDALALYTDWKRLRMVHNEEWNCLVETMERNLDTYDIILNLTQYQRAAMYLSKESYEEMINR